jgi:N-acetylmuramoyl-L-alanine amidase
MMAAALVVVVASFLYGWIRGDFIETTSWVVANKVILLDPGHGGPDGGAVGPRGTLEKDITLSTALRIEKFLSQGGARVVLTRRGDHDLGSSGQSLRSRKREDLQQRVDLIQKNGADLFVSIHTNAFGTIWTGAQTFYSPSSPEGGRLARCVQGEIRRMLRNTHRQAKALDCYVLERIEDIPAVIIEIGFLSNPQEEIMLNQPHYQQRIAYAVYAGIIKYLAGEDPKE